MGLRSLFGRVRSRKQPKLEAAPSPSEIFAAANSGDRAARRADKLAFRRTFRRPNMSSVDVQNLAKIGYQLRALERERQAAEDARYAQA